MENTNIQISTNGGKDWKETTCAPLKNTAIYKGKSPEGLAIFELSNGTRIETQSDDELEEGVEYEYKITFD